jgi:diguanylate cyclase (GGDEF)-like protein
MIKGHTDAPVDGRDPAAKPPLALWEPPPASEWQVTASETEAASGARLDDDPSLRHPVTGLIGSALLADRLRHTLAASRNSNRTVLVALVELDRFGLADTDLDDEIGNQILNVVALRLIEGLRSTDTVAQLGRQQFAIIVEGPGDPEFLCQRLIESIGAPMDIDGISVWMSASVGGSIGNGDDPEEFMRFAAIALQRSKERGGDSCTVLGRS